MQHQVATFDVRVLVKMVDARCVEGGGTTLDAMHLVSLLQEELRKVGTILPGDASDQCLLQERTSSRILRL